jgi:methionyl-tRNA synthetase
VPEEPDHVFYVWMDALANYITALGYGEEGTARKRYVEYWEGAAERFHLVGKEIIRFHCLYWPAMLEAAGLPVPTRLFAHGHLTKNGKKLSKTTGNVIDPEALVDRHGPDPVRYFLLREGSFGQDWDFTDEAFRGRYNADLANDLGNLVSRALTMVEKYCGGRVPLVPPAAARGLQLSPGVCTRILDCYEQLDFSGALTQLWAEIRRLNQEVVQTAPWELAKDPGQKGVLDSFLGRLLGQMAEIATLVSPVMPRAARRIYRMLGLDREPQPSDLAGPVLKPGAPLGAIEALFPRVEKEKTVSETRPPSGVSSADAPATGPAPTSGGPAPATGDKVDIADFAKLELRVARITSAERVAGSKKLIKVEVDLGTETRQVVAGIAETYPPESLVGRTVVLVANLKPAKLMGVESNGMVLAASVEGRAVLCTFDRDVAPGTRVK